jgi:hypothetical protein
VIREQAGIDAVIVEGERSQFDVVNDGTLLFSKQAEGRFPEEDEILTLLQ